MRPLSPCFAWSMRLRTCPTSPRLPAPSCRTGLAAKPSPCAYAGAWLVHAVGADDVQGLLKRAIGVTLLVASTAYFLRAFFEMARYSGDLRSEAMSSQARPSGRSMARPAPLR